SRWRRPTNARTTRPRRSRISKRPSSSIRTMRRQNSNCSSSKEFDMRRVVSTVPAIALLTAATAFAQAPAAKPAAAKASAQAAQGAKKQPLVEFEMMTWPEVKQALADGKTTALFYTGGTEQRGPQNVNGGHTLMGREIVRTIALRLGNAIAMP